jgi:hypothetical protein
MMLVRRADRSATASSATAQSPLQANTARHRTGTLHSIEAFDFNPCREMAHIHILHRARSDEGEEVEADRLGSLGTSRNVEAAARNDERSLGSARPWKSHLSM